MMSSQDFDHTTGPLFSALVHFLNEIHLSTDSGIVLVLLGIRAAFNTVNHSKLLDKLEGVGKDFWAQC